MKSQKAQNKVLMVVALLSALSSCSSLVDSSREKIEGNPPDPKWVSRNQYDQLMGKYKNLLSEYERLKETSLTSSGPDLIGEIQTSAPTEESVDVFGKDGLIQKVKEPNTPKPVIAKPINESDLNKEITLFRKAVALEESNNTDQALKIFQVMEKSYTKQISARARFHIASIYFKKSQFDLALQVAEKMINNDAFSGVVLDAIKIAVNCCENLGLEEKKLKYNSMLYDVFGITG